MPQTVLLADDNIAVQKLVEMTLQNEGYDVVTSDNGLSALDLALKETPGLILADYSLEGLDVVSFVRKTRQRERLSNVPIVLLVNSTDHYDLSELESVGVQAFIEKPIDSKSLVEEVNKRIAASVQSEVVSDTSSSVKEDNLSEEEMKIEELLGWTSSDSQSQETEEKAVSADEAGPSAEPQGDSMADLASEPSLSENSLEETQYFQPPPIPEDLEEEKVPEANAQSMDEIHCLQQLQDEPFLSSVLSQMESEVEEARSSEGETQQDSGNIIQDAVDNVLGENFPDRVKSSLTPEAITAIIEKVVWDVVPALAEIEIKKEMKRLQADEG
ncbi:MAG: response regulator [Nitrospira sp.]|nr:response regulator [Candidatus Manganitrophaceae bacterium]HIL34666.1 response regulator [Candidatus Manganitrophaceae bacterium]